MSPKHKNKEDKMAGQPTPREGFRWECPYCGASRVNGSDHESGEANAIAALRTHVVASDGAKHGPRNEFPADFDTVELADYVSKVDSRR